jgi:hypothetical protein
VGRWSSSLGKIDPSFRTAAIFEVVAPLSIPMKMGSLMSWLRRR